MESALYPSNTLPLSKRGISAFAASAVCALVVLALLEGLAGVVKERRETASTKVTLVPLPVPDPPPPVVQPEPPRPQILRNTVPDPGTPRPIEAAPIQQPDRTIVEAAPPGPPPALLDGNGGAGTGTGTSDGTGGNGKGGAGTGSGRGTGIRLVPASWARIPGKAQLHSYNPRAARIDRVSGEVLLACRVQPTKRVTSCRVLRETPGNYGFGRAAVDASVTFRVNPPRRNDSDDTRTWVAIPVSFKND